MDLSSKHVFLSMVLKFVGILGSDAVSVVTEIEILKLGALDGRVGQVLCCMWILLMCLELLGLEIEIFILRLGC